MERAAQCRPLFVNWIVMTGFLLRAVMAGLLFLPLAAPPALAYEQTETFSSGSYLAGRSAAKQRDNGVASDYLTHALRADGGNPLLVEKLFLLELSEGDIAAAEAHAAEIIKFNSQQRMARIVLGLKEFRARRYAEARKHLEQAAYTPVGELTAVLLIAWSHAGEGDLNPALKALDRLDGNEAFTNFKSFHSALIAAYLGNAIRAEASFRKAFEEAGSSLRVVQAYGNFLERAGRGPEAAAVYRGFLEGDENPLVVAALANSQKNLKPQPFIASPGAGAAEALFSLSTSMTDEQSIDVALLYARLALSLDADRPVAFTLLGDIYEDMKRFDKAIEAYEQVPPGSPLFSNAEMEIAVGLQRIEKPAEALAKLGSLIAREPENYDAIVTLGNLHRSNEDYASAAKVYDDAISLIKTPVPGHWRVYYYDGIAHERLKQWDIAEQRFRKALELSPNESSVLNYLGYSMIEKKINLAEAMEMVKKAVELKPNDGYIIDSLGWAYYQLGDYEQAVVHIERAVELLPADPIIAEHLGDAYWRVGRTLEARFQWQHARDNKPEPEDLKRIEDKIRNGLPAEAPVNPAQTAPAQSNG